MDLTLNYTTDLDTVKSQNSEGQISLVIGYNNKPFDLHLIDNHTITVKIGNAEGYIQDITVDTSREDDNKQYAGTFDIPLADDHIQNLPPDIYYLEVWINAKDQQGNERQLIFPSSEVLPFTITSNMVNGSNSMPMITFDAIQQNWNDFRDYVLSHEADIKKNLATMDSTTNSFVDKVDSGVGGYANFINSADSNIGSMASSGSSYINNAVEYANENVSNIDSKVNSAHSVIDDAANNVYSIVDSDVASAKDSIAAVTSSADTDTTGTAAHATSTVDSKAQSVVTNVTSTMNSADNHIDHAADGIRGQVNGIVTSGSNYINNVAHNLNNTTNSAVSNINNATANIDSVANSAVANVNYTVNSADNNMSNFASGINAKTSSADVHIDQDVNSAHSNVDSTVTSTDNHVENRTASAESNVNSTVNSADTHMNNFASNINGKTSSADTHIDWAVDSAQGNINFEVSSTDSYVDDRVTSAERDVNTTVNSADAHMSDFASDVNGRTSSADSHIDVHVSSADNHMDSLFNNVNGKASSADNHIDERVKNIDTQANSAYTRIKSSASSVTSSGTSYFSSETQSGIDTLDGVVSGAAAHLRKGVTSDVTNNVNHSMDDLRSTVHSNNADVMNNDKDVSVLNSHVNMTRKDIATVYNQLFTSAAINQQNLDRASDSLKSLINKGQTTSEAKSAYVSLNVQLNSLSAANSNLGTVLGSNTGSKLASLAQQFSDFDNTTQKGLSNSIASNATDINNLSNAINGDFSSANAKVDTDYNSLRGYDDGLQRQINDNNTAHNNSESNLQNQINGKPNWVDINWTRSNVAPSLANSAKADANNYTNTKAGSAINQANINMESNRGSLSARDNDLQNQISNNNNAHNGTESNLQNLINNKLQIISSGDMDLNDDYHTNTMGVYNFAGAHLTNAPVDSNNTYWGNLFVSNTGGGQEQRLFVYPDNVWVRGYGGDPASWSAWRKVAYQDGIDNLQNQINSRPTWDDENWTRSNANQAATNALNQANANMNNLPHWVDENWTRNNVAPSLANSARDAAIGTANGNMETNRVNLQNQITGNYNNGLVYKGTANMWDWNSMNTIGIYSLDGSQRPWNTPYNDNQSKYGILIVIPNGNPSWGQKIQVFFDNNGANGNNPTMSWRIIGGAVNNTWHVNANMSDITNLQNQINSHPNWNDENWTRNNVVPGAKQDAINQANQAATNALNQANAHTDSAIKNNGSNHDFSNAKSLPNTDLNKDTTPGIYKFGTSDFMSSSSISLSNAPTINYWNWGNFLSSVYGILIVDKIDNDNVYQKYIDLGGTIGYAVAYRMIQISSPSGAWHISDNIELSSAYSNNTGTLTDLNQDESYESSYMVENNMVNISKNNNGSYLENSPTTGTYSLYLRNFGSPDFGAGIQEAIVTPINIKTSNDGDSRSFNGFSGNPTTYIRTVGNIGGIAGTKTFSSWQALGF